MIIQRIFCIIPNPQIAEKTFSTAWGCLESIVKLPENMQVEVFGPRKIEPKNI